MFARRLLILRLLETIVRELSVSWRATVQAAETHTQAPTAPENTPQSESAPIKKQHGGKRAGTGRKPNLLKRIIGRLKLAALPKSWPASTWKPQSPKIMKKGSLSLKQRTLADLWIAHGSGGKRFWRCGSRALDTRQVFSPGG